MNDKRPHSGDGGSYVTTPMAASMLDLLGGKRVGSVAITRDEMQSLTKLYCFKREPTNERPPKPVLPEKPMLPWERQEAERAHKEALQRWEKWVDPQPFMQAGANRNMLRHAEHDGMRLIAWLAKFVPEGQDPLKVLIQLAVEAGFDVAPEDQTWSEEEGE